MASTVKYKSDMDIVINAQDNTSDTVRRIESSVIRMVGAIASATAVLTGLAFPVREAAEFEAALLDVKKTTGFTIEQIKDLGDEMIIMSQKVNVSAIDLTRIAAIAGQLGLGVKGGTEAIAAFTDTAARFSSVLDVSVERAATNIAKITNVFDIAITEAESVSAAINEISNSSTAAGSDILDIVNRVGDIGNISLSDAIGIAAFSKDVGLANEVASTSFTKMIANLTVRAEDFASLMGTSTQDWVDVVNNDALGALFSVADQLNNMGTAASNAFIKTNLGGGRIFTAFTKLKNEIHSTENAMDDYRISALQAQIAGTSSIEEQANVLSGLSAQTTILVQNFTNLAEVVGNDALPYLKVYVKEWSAFLKDPATIEGVKELARDIGETAGHLLQLVKAVVQNTDTWNNFYDLLKLIISLKIGAYFARMGAGLATNASNILKMGAAYKLASAAQKEYIAGTAQMAKVTATANAVTANGAQSKALLGAAGLGNFIAAVKQAKTAQSSLTLQTVANNKVMEASYTQVYNTEKTARSVEHGLALRVNAAKTEKALLIQRIADLKANAAAEKSVDEKAYYAKIRLLNQELAAVKRMHRAATTDLTLTMKQQEAIVAGSRKAMALNVGALAGGTGAASVAAVGRAAASSSVSVAALGAQVSAATVKTISLKAAMGAVGTATKALGRGFLAAIPIVGQVATLGWLAYEAWNYFFKANKKDNDELVRKNANFKRLTRTLEQQTEATRKYNDELQRQLDIGSLQSAGLLTSVSGSGDDDLYVRRTALTDALTQATIKLAGADKAYNSYQESAIPKREALIALVKEYGEAQENLAKIEATPSTGRQGADAARAIQIDTLRDKLEALQKGIVAANADWIQYDKGIKVAEKAVASSAKTMEIAARAQAGMVSEGQIALFKKWLPPIQLQRSSIKSLTDDYARLQEELKKGGEVTFSIEEDVYTGLAALDQMKSTIEELERTNLNSLRNMREDFKKFGTESGENMQGLEESAAKMLAAFTKADLGRDAVASLNAQLTLVDQHAQDAALSMSKWKTLVPTAVRLKTLYEAMSKSINAELRPALQLARDDQETLNDRMEDFAVISREANNEVIQSFEEVRLARDKVAAAGVVANADTKDIDKRIAKYNLELAAIKANTEAGKQTKYHAEALTLQVTKKLNAAKDEKIVVEKMVEAEKERARLASLGAAIEIKKAALKSATEAKDVAAVNRASAQLTELGQEFTALSAQIATITYDNTEGKEVNLISDETVAKMEVRARELNGIIQSVISTADTEIESLAESKVNILVKQETAANTVLNTIGTQLDKLAGTNANLKKLIAGLVITTEDMDKAFNGSALDNLTTVFEGRDLSTSMGLTKAQADIAKLSQKSSTYMSELNRQMTESTVNANAMYAELVRYRNALLNAGMEEAMTFTPTQMHTVVDEMAKLLSNMTPEDIALGIDEAAFAASVQSALSKDTFNIEADLEFVSNNIDVIASTLAAVVSAKLPDGAIRRASGGAVWGRGTATSDSIPAWLSNGEYVINAATVSKFGTSFFDDLNFANRLALPRYASGGLAGAAQNITNNNGLQLAGVHRIDVSSGGESYTLFADKRSTNALDTLLSKVVR